jgi:hypothetical protein
MVRARGAAVDAGCSLPTVRGAAHPGGRNPPGYRQRAPERGALFRLVHEHLETLLAEARSLRVGDPCRASSSASCGMF